jgi:Pyruvate/2-oxoacid:ferredoxin oxidoreductase delta subunit
MSDDGDWTREDLEETVSSMTAVTVPVHMHIEGKQRILDVSEMEKVLRQAKLSSVGDRFCRKKRKKCDAPIDVCLCLDKDAEEQIRKGLAIKASLEQALDALKRSHKAGLVHIACTFEGKEKPRVVCSCCSCCCQSMSALIRFGISNAVVVSKYVASNNAETCISCGKCVQRCQFGARSLADDKLAFDKAKCFGCGVCVTTCPTESIPLTKR